jgi:flagellar motility protein MotE (MotC chaperone)
MALCHELAHVRRADLWLGCVPAIAERAFFFHPLVHAAVREYALWREAACDAAVLNALDASPHEYGRLLLDLGLSRRTAGPVAAGAPWSFTNLKRRIAMLGAPSTRSIGSRLIAATVVTLSAAAIAPLTLAARPSSRTASAPPAAGAVSSPEPTERSREQEKQEKQEKQERRLNFVMFLDEDTTTMSGDIQDIKRAKRFKRPGERMLWFRQADREYVVRDPEMLRQIEAIWRPVSEIGERQGTIGAKQGELGARQGALGAEQGEIGARQAAIGAVQGRIGERQAEVGARQAALAEREARQQTAAQRDAIEQARRALEQQMRELDREIAQLDVKMRELEKPMDDLGQQMDALGRQMDVLGREMDVLGRQMDEAVREAEAAMREILDRAVATGAAELVR